MAWEKTRKDCHDNWSPHRELNRAISEYKSEASNLKFYCQTGRPSLWLVAERAGYAGQQGSVTQTFCSARNGTEYKCSLLEIGHWVAA
jgi:hypothetical protein